MPFKRKITVVISVILAAVLGFSVCAAANLIAEESSGTYESYIVNRINMKTDNTAFAFNNPQKGDLLTCSLYFSIEKTEAEFYGKLSSLSISGVKTESTVFTAGENNGTALFPTNVILPVIQTEPSPLEWEISFSFIYDGETTEYELSLDADYTTGVTYELAQRYITSVPITVSVTKG